MSDSAAKLDILIAIKAQIDDLLRTKQGFHEAKAEAESFSSILKEGLGIGSGLALAERGIDMVKEATIGAAEAAVELANKVRDGADNLEMSRKGFQVFGAIMREAGGDQERMTEAISHNNRSLVEARTLVGPAAAAYRTLALNAAELEGLSVEKRMEAIGRAINNSTDKTAAFAAAGHLLGSRNLPVLLTALRNLGSEGYDELAAKAEKAGRIMGDDTIERLHRAEKAIKQLKQKFVIEVGETLATLTKLKDSAVKDFAGTFFGLLKAYLTGDYTDLALTVLKNAPDPEVKPPPDRTDEEAAALARANRLEAIKQSELELAKIKLDQGLNLSNLAQTQKQRDIETGEHLEAEIAQRKILIGLLLEEKEGELADPHARALKLAQLRAEQDLAKQDLHHLARGGESAASKSKAAAEGVNDPRVNQGFLSAGDGVMAGFQNWVAQAGSVGQQIAASLQSTIGTVTQGIGSTIAGWATTGRVSLASIQQLGMTIFTSMLQTLVQIGVQQVINGNAAKAIALGWKALTSSLRAADTVETVASESAKTPILATNAALSSASSFGLSAVIGIAALALLIGAFIAGFSGGGYTGAGSVFQPAGVVHKGEVVFSQADIARHGGVDAVEALRLNGTASAGDFQSAAPPGNISAASALAAGGVSAAGYAAVSTKPQRTLVLVDSRETLDQLRRQPEWDSHVVDSVSRNRGVLING